MGTTGYRKSTLTRVMFGEWSREGLPSLESKDAQVALRNCWGIEIPELSSWMRVDKNLKKDFISRRVDTYRPPYGKTDIDFPRACVFIGTTNDLEILDDETGNRRYWPILVRKVIDTDRVKELRDLVWAEARDAYLNREVFNSGDISGGEAYRAQFNRTDPWDLSVEKFFEGKEQWDGRLSELYQHTLGLGDPETLAKLTRKDLDRISAIVHRLGFQRKPGTYRWVKV
jgi:predicted P-loop ATPase